MKSAGVHSYYEYTKNFVKFLTMLIYKQSYKKFREFAQYIASHACPESFEKLPRNFDNSAINKLEFGCDCKMSAEEMREALKSDPDLFQIVKAEVMLNGSNTVSCLAQEERCPLTNANIFGE